MRNTDKERFISGEEKGRPATSYGTMAIIAFMRPGYRLHVLIIDDNNQWCVENDNRNIYNS